ncbi:MAG: signal peptidase I [Armatimonadota bacterium]
MQSVRCWDSLAGKRVTSSRWTLCVAAVALLGAVAAAPVRVGVTVGHSMEPVLRPGQPFLFVRRDGAAEPVTRGEVVLLRLNGQTCVKRIFAVGGDQFLSVQADKYPYRGTPLQLGESARRWKLRFPHLSMKRVRVPRGTVYVLGDGAWSRDSRDVGPIPVSDVLGRVLLPGGQGSDLCPNAQALRDLPPKPSPHRS